ncbi:uncharacterized protein BDZ99DRAFT_523709 [Mytilinidion resinicola]|uniref:Uncharacterized protein n=1 Tax=Mytilinidion resinicola TaxID=574789 RepID=A0A6A6YDT1_9PEZI|nr:uncharacterized protein BDZ99DRAFT_523709 [Mytilinidion resinicola]KAF2806245.1 hypothetical protein BDZ99DRAFT_523709 [Mytilinidion resinicola]
MTLQSRAERTSLLLSKLLEYRKVDKMNGNTIVLTRMETVACSQRDHLKHILQKTGTESRLTKVLTFIATVYMPANLIAAIFSSDLVHVPSGPAEPDFGILHVRKAMWVYAVLSVTLSSITFASIFIYRVWKSRIPRKQLEATLPMLSIKDEEMTVNPLLI